MTKKVREVKKTTKTKPKRWLFCITKKDRAAMEYLQSKYLFGSLVNSLRFALRGQCERDESEKHTKKDQSLQEVIKETVINMLSKAHSKAAPAMKMWSCWVSEEEIAQMDTIGKHWSLDKRAEAARFALRVQAQLEGFEPEDGNWL